MSIHKYKNVNASLQNNPFSAVYSNTFRVAKSGIFLWAQVGRIDSGVKGMLFSYSFTLCAFCVSLMYTLEFA